MNKLSKWDYKRQRDRLIHELRQQGLSLRAIARALHCSKTTVAACAVSGAGLLQNCALAGFGGKHQPRSGSTADIDAVWGEVSGATYASLFGEVSGASGNADFRVPSGGATAATLYTTGIGLDCNDAQC